MVCQFRSQTTLDKPIEEVFEFFSNAQNLELLTPTSLKFKILTSIPIEMKTGTVIDYKISLFGIPMKWKSEITDFQEGARFIDSQIKGPYRKWVHLHEFESINGGTLMTDTVDYEIGFGSLGTIAHAVVVKKEIERIFRYRTFVLDSIWQS